MPLPRMSLPRESLPRTLVAVGALLLALSAGVGQAAPGLGKVSTVQLPRGMRVRDAVLHDMDADGGEDLVTTVSRRGPARARWLRIHLRRAGAVAFVAEPDDALRLTPDVVAFAVADMDPAPGSEVVLFTATGAFVWKRGGTERERPRKIVTGDFLWQLPHPRDVFAWQAGVRDLDGDGLPDVLLPEPGGYRIAFQRRDGGGGSSFETESVLRIDAFARAGETPGESRGGIRAKMTRRRDQFKATLRIGDGKDSGTLLEVEESVPAPALRDWDGDGLLDLMAQTREELLVFHQTTAGAFEAEPSVRLRLPVTVNRRRRLDPSYSAHSEDLDRDGRADYVIVAGDQRSEDVRTQVLVYTQGGRGKSGDASLFGKKGRPRQALFVSGFAGSPRLVDVDGDGLPDLVLGALRIDLLDTIRAAKSGRLDVEIYVYLNRGGTFSKRPDLAHEISLPAEGLRQSRKSLAARFVRDVTGDGVRDFLVRDEPGRVRLLLTRKTRGGLVLVPRPLWETSLDEDAEIRVHEPLGGGPTELLLLGDKQIHHVRFR